MWETSDESKKTGSPVLSSYDFNMVFQLRSGNLIDRGQIEYTIGKNLFWQDLEQCEMFLRKYPSFLFYGKYDPKVTGEILLGSDYDLIYKLNMRNYELMVESKYPHEWATVINFIQKMYLLQLGIPEPKQKVIKRKLKVQPIQEAIVPNKLDMGMIVDTTKRKYPKLKTSDIKFIIVIILSKIAGKNLIRAGASNPTQKDKAAWVHSRFDYLSETTIHDYICKKIHHSKWKRLDNLEMRNEVLKSMNI